MLRRCFVWPGRAEEWKSALKARLAARKMWMETKIAAATAGDWGTYRVATKKGATGWEGHLADALGDGKDPQQEIHNHLQAVYGGPDDKVSPFPFPEAQVASVPNFTVEELRDALRKGRKGVAVGPDKVSPELLLARARSWIGSTASYKGSSLCRRSGLGHLWYCYLNSNIPRR